MFPRAWVVLLSKDGAIRLNFLNNLDEVAYIRQSKVDIVIIDGVTESPEHKILQNSVFPFLSPRKSISVASKDVKFNMEDDEYNEISHFESCPWSIEDYCSSLRDARFLESTSEKF